MPRSRTRTLLFSAQLLLAGFAQGAPLPRFPDGAVWNQDVSTAALHQNSASMISTWATAGGFGGGQFLLNLTPFVLHAPPGAPTQPIVADPLGSYQEPDCEPLGTHIPLPAGGAIENSVGQDYSCNSAVERCRLLVVSGRQVYEAREATLTGQGLQTNCLAIWSLDRVYPPEGRGDQCDSATSGGTPIASLLVNADDVFAAMQRANAQDRHLGHAILFHLPSDRMAKDIVVDPGGGLVFVRPNSSPRGVTGPAGSIPFGARLRLRPDFPFAGYTEGAQVILRTLQRYGMVLGEGGSIALQGENDRFTTHKWAEAGLAITINTFTGTSGAAVAPADFQVVDTGPRIAGEFVCRRTLLQDGFE